MADLVLDGDIAGRLAFFLTGTVTAGVLITFCVGIVRILLDTGLLNGVGKIGGGKGETVGTEGLGGGRRKTAGCTGLVISGVVDRRALRLGAVTGT